MTKMEYAEAIATRVNGTTVIVKKNGVECIGVSVPVDDKMYGTIYIDDMFNNAVSIDRATTIVLDAVDSSHPNFGTLLNDIMDYTKIKDKLRLRMYSAYNEQKYDLSYSAEKYGFKDLVLVPTIFCKEYSIILSQYHADMWGVSKEQLFEDCYSNTISDIRFITMEELLGISIPNVFPTMFIITNSYFNYGASAVLGTKDKLEKMFPDGYIIIPSSLHEVMVAPLDENVDINTLDALIKEVNNESLNQQDWLSCHKYVFR